MVQKQLALWRFCLRVDSVVRANVLPETSRYHFHDVSATFSSTAEPIYVDDDCHISESGNARIAEIMASDILTLVPGR
jgi:hypothetical protein